MQAARRTSTVIDANMVTMFRLYRGVSLGHIPPGRQRTFGGDDSSGHLFIGTPRGRVQVVAMAVPQDPSPIAK
jgi:hypothetical protein